MRWRLRVHENSATTWQQHLNRCQGNKIEVAQLDFICNVLWWSNSHMHCCATSGTSWAYICPMQLSHLFKLVSDGEAEYIREFDTSSRWSISVITVSPYLPKQNMKATVVSFLLAGYVAYACAAAVPGSHPDFYGINFYYYGAYPGKQMCF